MSDELDSCLFLRVESNHSPYYQLPADGWEAAILAFPGTGFDVEEASKCFAVNGYTAVVFHLMRIMEVGLGALGASLNDPSLDPTTNRNWEAILRKCRSELTKQLQQRSREWRLDELFYSGATERLMAVKDAWRNPTMHVGRKYTEEEALDALNSVRAFMRLLSTKLHE